MDEEHTGRGIATAALRQLTGYAFDDLRLHRLQAEVLPDNVASKRVLSHLGFCHYGTAPHYLRIQGRWQTHDLYQLINPHSSPERSAPATCRRRRWPSDVDKNR
ncbi:GNAT family N-acetyltransferase [Ruania albidiflava]|uniref:GNAT family N-acetyltransferase n=1 Tax=Ruania albidiflava TaxID=366586 RepID=UPI0023F0929E|nr:GNAT family protein [Ruania albidiflava]